MCRADLPPFFEFVVPGVLLNGIGLLGFCGNILSIIVLSRPQMKSSINCILIGINFDPKLLKSLFLLSKIRLSFSYWKQDWIPIQFHAAGKPFLLLNEKKPKRVLKKFEESPITLLPHFQYFPSLLLIASHCCSNTVHLLSFCSTNAFSFFPDPYSMLS